MRLHKPPHQPPDENQYARHGDEKCKNINNDHLSESFGVGWNRWHNRKYLYNLTIKRYALHLPFRKKLMPHPCYEWRDNEAREVVGEFNPFETKDDERDRENEQPADGIDGI